MEVHNFKKNWVTFKTLFEKEVSSIETNDTLRQDTEKHLFISDMSSSFIGNPALKNGEVVIRIPKNTQGENLRNLKNLLMTNPGNHHVSLVFEGSRTQKVDLKINVGWDEALAHQISQVLGMDNR